MDTTKCLKVCFNVIFLSKIRIKCKKWITRRLNLSNRLALLSWRLSGSGDWKYNILVYVYRNKHGKENKEGAAVAQQNTTVVGSIPTRRYEIYCISFFHSGNEANRGVEFHYSTRKSRIPEGSRRSGEQKRLFKVRSV